MNHDAQMTEGSSRCKIKTFQANKAYKKDGRLRSYLFRDLFSFHEWKSRNNVYVKVHGTILCLHRRVWCHTLVCATFNFFRCVVFWELFSLHYNSRAQVRIPIFRYFYVLDYDVTTMLAYVNHISTYVQYVGYFSYVEPWDQNSDACWGHPKEQSQFIYLGYSNR